MKKYTAGKLLLCFVILVLPAAQPYGAEKISALVIDGQNNHDWKLTTPYLKAILENTGLFAVEVATAPPSGEDLSAFSPDFENYDVLVMNYNGEPWPAATRESFERYVRNGGGLVIFHAADNAFPEWKEYNLMIGLGGWGDRNEKDGPYLHWENGKAVRETVPAKPEAMGNAMSLSLTTVCLITRYWREPAPGGSIPWTNCMTACGGLPRMSPCWLPPILTPKPGGPANTNRYFLPLTMGRAGSFIPYWAMMMFPAQV